MDELKRFEKLLQERPFEAKQVLALLDEFTLIRVDNITEYHNVTSWYDEHPNIQKVEPLRLTAEFQAREWNPKKHQPAEAVP